MSTRVTQSLRYGWDIKCAGCGYLEHAAGGWTAALIARAHRRCCPSSSQDHIDQLDRIHPRPTEEAQHH